MFSSAAAPKTKDVELSQPPPESVSKIAFSPTQDILAVASWDNNVCNAPFALQLEIADGLGTPLQCQCPGSVGAKSNVFSPRTCARFMLVKSMFQPNLRVTVELMDRADHTSTLQDATMQSRCTMSQQVRTRR